VLVVSSRLMSAAVRLHTIYRHSTRHILLKTDYKFTGCETDEDADQQGIDAADYWVQ
jgi:hypothetical protein